MAWIKVGNYWKNTAGDDNDPSSYMTDAQYQASGVGVNPADAYYKATPGVVSESGMTLDPGSFSLVSPAAGATAASTVQKIMDTFGPSAGGILGLLQNQGYFNQFSDWQQIAPQVGEMTASLQKAASGGDFFGDMVKGTAIHGGNILDLYRNNPQMMLTAGAFGPAGSSLESDLWGVDQKASDARGRPSASTQAEMEQKGVDRFSTDFVSTVGSMVGGAAAGLGLANAAGAGAGSAGYESAAGGGSAPTSGSTLMPAATAESPSTLASWGLTETSPGVWQSLGSGTASGVSGASGSVGGDVATSGGVEYGSAAGGASGGVGTGAAGAGSGLMNPQVLGALGGAALSSMGGGSKPKGTITTNEGLPDWLIPYAKPALDKYSTEVMNYNTDPYGIMPSAMQEFLKTIQGQYLDPSTNKWLPEYFRLGAERVKGALSPTFGHMQAFGQHSGYNEALSRGLGDLAVGLYGGAYEKERDRQNQMIGGAPNFLTQGSLSKFAPYGSYLSSLSGLGSKKEQPYFDDPWGRLMGGAMVGSQVGKAFYS
jgi:hypothetical protein